MNKSKRDEIAARAHRIWEEEGRPDNKAEEHWARAVQELAREAGVRQMGSAAELPTGQQAEGEAPGTMGGAPADPAAPSGAAPSEDQPRRARSPKRSGRPRGK